MVQMDTNQAILSKRSSKDIHPRLCILHKWSDYNGYGIHLTCNENWRGLHIDDIEPNSPAESAGLLREDIILAVNGRSIENEDFFVILSFIQLELKHDQIRFLVLDPHSAALAQRDQINIDENHVNCIRTETPKFMKISTKSSQTTTQNSSDETSDSNHNLKREPRMCSIILRPGVEPLGISLQSDTDFSHIITHVQSNSPAARAGIEKYDCIISLNNTPLLHISFEDVLYFLAKSRNDLKLNFLVAKKSYLLQSSHDHLALNSYDQLLSSEHLLARNRSFTLPATKISYEQSRKTQQENTITNEQYDRLSLQMYNNLNIPKHKKRRGKIVKGIGPATALRFSWSATSEKTIDYQRIGMDEVKDIFNSLQVGMTNPSPKRTRRITTHLSNVSFSDDEQLVAQSSSSSSVKRLHHSRNLALKRNHVVHTPSSILKHNRNILNAIPNTPKLCIGEQGLSMVLISL